MPGQKTMRSALLEKLLGRKKAAEVGDVTAEAQKMLDEAGVQRKSRRVLTSRRTKDAFDDHIALLMTQLKSEEAYMEDLVREKRLAGSDDAYGEITDEISATRNKIERLQAELRTYGVKEQKPGTKLSAAEFILDKMGLLKKEDAPAEGEGGTPLVDVLAAVGATEVADAVKRVFEVLTKTGQLEAVAKAVGSEEELSNLLAAAIAGGAKNQDAEVAAQANAAPAGTEVVTQPAAKSRRSKGVEESMASALRDLQAERQGLQQQLADAERTLTRRGLFPEEVIDAERRVAKLQDMIQDVEDQIDEINFGMSMRESKESRSVKELIGDYVTESTRDLARIAKAQLVLATSVDELKPLATQIKELTDRLADVEEFIADTPRQASKAAETLITNEKLQKEIQDQVGETEMVAGIRVRKVSGLNGNGGQS